MGSFRDEPLSARRLPRSLRRSPLQPAGHAFDGALHALDDLIDVRSRDDERRGKSQNVSMRDRAGDDPFLETRSGELLPDLAIRVEALLLGRVLSEFDGGEQS